jgi:hypothetical protein
MRLVPFVALSAAMALSACEGWTLSPLPYETATVAPSHTPAIRTPTPFILSPSSVTPPPTSTQTETATLVTSTSTATVPATGTFTVSPTSTPLTPSPLAPAGTITVDILGCDTSVDILHGMGEVTNAYVTLSNSTAADVTDVCATLRGLDEGRPHPDKTKCIPSLPVGYQTTLKLTVDTTYQQDSPIQVDVTSGDTLILRTGEPACTAIGLLPPDVSDFGYLRPIP